MRFVLEEEHRRVLATAGLLLRQHQLDFAQVGGAERLAYSSVSAGLLRREWGIFSTTDVRRELSRLTDPNGAPVLRALDRARALALASWAFNAYLLELDEAWAVMFEAARELQLAYPSWRELAEGSLAGHAALLGEDAGHERMSGIARQLLEEWSGPWRELSYGLRLEPGRAPPLLEQTVHTVDAGGAGDFSTVGAALQAARWGDRIRVLPGVYRERLWIETPVELEGVGAARIENELGCCLMVKASAAVARNLQFKSGTNPAGEAMHAVIVQGHFLHLVGCDLAADNLGLHLRSEAAHVVLRDTEVHDAGRAGILVEEGVLVMEGGGVRNSRLGNVQIEGITEARLERVRLERAGQAGLVVRKGAEALVSDSTLANNLAGVDALVGGRATLSGCRIEGNRGGGMRAFGINSQLFAERCRLIDNGEVNVGADEGAQAVVSGGALLGGACAAFADHGGTVQLIGCRVGLGSEGLVREMNGGKVTLIDAQADVQPRA